MKYRMTLPKNNILRHALFEFYYRALSGGKKPPEDACECERCKERRKQVK
jgi:hypothetical protein